MALWNKTQQLPKTMLQQVTTIYGEHFPIEVRHRLATWIDKQSWKTIDPDNPQHEHLIKELVSSFIREIENEANSVNANEDAFLKKIKFLNVANSYKEQSATDSVNLFRTIRSCWLNEMKLVQYHETQLPNQPQQNIMNFASVSNAAALNYANPIYAEINQNIEVAKSNTQKISDMIRRFTDDHQSFMLFNDNYQQLRSAYEHHQQISNQMVTQRNAAEYDFQKRMETLNNTQFMITDCIKQNCQSIGESVSNVFDKQLVDWKRNQQLSGNGQEFDSSHLDILQNWCERLSEIIWTCLTQIKEMLRILTNICSVITLTGAEAIATNLGECQKVMIVILTRVVTDSFLIEKQPPQVMKTNTRFTAKVRLLVGGTLGVHLNPPQVKVSIISEAQANYVLTERHLKGEVSGDILNNTGTMEYDGATKQLSITFRNMQLKKIKRAEKKGSESVVDEKFSLFFSTSLNVCKTLDINAWCLSLPVTVIVHGNQEPHAWATITWDNAFAEYSRKPFVVPDKVSWDKVASALNLKFTSVTGRCLSPDNLRYLAEKLFKVHCDDYDTMQLSWSQFSKESLTDRNFTFWDWFYAIMKLTREHLKPLWIDGCIKGFVRKKQAEDLLSNCQTGTFLMRFSDSELGGITIAWNGGTGQQNKVIMLQPFTAKDFAIRCLADRINDLSQLQYLYPNVRKEKAFGRYYTPFTDAPCANTNGYVKPSLKTHVPGWGDNPGDNRAVLGPGGLQSYPTTPNPILTPNSPNEEVAFMDSSSGYHGTFSANNTMDYDNFPEMEEWTT